MAALAPEPLLDVEEEKKLYLPGNEPRFPRHPASCLNDIPQLPGS